MNTKSALIITSIVNDAVRILPDTLHAPYDMVICCDAGIERAIELGVRPNIILGDFDSTKTISPEELADDASDEASDDSLPEIVTLPHEKDMTDTEAACDLAFSRGAGVMTIIGGLGGRFDHTMANIGLMSKYLGKADIFILDGDNFIRMLAPGEYKIISGGYQYLGLIAYGGPVKSLTVHGTFYTLDDHDLTPDTSLAISNEIVEEPATVSFKEGQLLVIQSNDKL